MSVPKEGTYIPLDQTMKIQINSATPGNSIVNATYTAQSSPVGPISDSGDIGKYFWVTHKSGQTPFCISFKAVQRPEGWPYCIVDSWNGYYRKDNTMVLTGTRAIVEAEGQTQSFSLGTHNFALSK